MIIILNAYYHVLHVFVKINILSFKDMQIITLLIDWNNIIKIMHGFWVLLFLGPPPPNRLTFSRPRLNYFLQPWLQLLFYGPGPHFFDAPTLIILFFKVFNCEIHKRNVIIELSTNEPNPRVSSSQINVNINSSFQQNSLVPSISLYIPPQCFWESYRKFSF